ncbi:MAG: hypothetical protein KGJ02_07645 [Verrucomicrobiota bacterium]|nr:hypothetical protein [Verrucomicrobiota bacterium]
MKGIAAVDVKPSLIELSHGSVDANELLVVERSAWVNKRVAVFYYPEKRQSIHYGPDRMKLRSEEPRIREWVDKIGPFLEKRGFLSLTYAFVNTHELRGVQSASQKKGWGSRKQVIVLQYPKKKITLHYGTYSRLRDDDFELLQTAVHGRKKI